MTDTSIYSLEHPSDTLPSGYVRDRKAICEPCLADRLSKGWSVVDKERPAFSLPCQDCSAKRQSARKTT